MVDQGLLPQTKEPRARLRLAGLIVDDSQMLAHKPPSTREQLESHGGLADVMVSGQQRGFTARGDDDLTWTDGESALEGFAGEWRQECREL